MVDSRHPTPKMPANPRARNAEIHVLTSNQTIPPKDFQTVLARGFQVALALRDWTASPEYRQHSYPRFPQAPTAGYFQL